MSSDPYVKRDVYFVAKTEKAVLVALGAEQNATQVWVPRSVLHASSDLAVEAAAKHEEMTLQVRQWFAVKEMD